MLFLINDVAKLGTFSILCHEILQPNRGWDTSVNIWTHCRTILSLQFHMGASEWLLARYHAFRA